MIYLKLLQLEFKSILRSAQFKTEIGMAVFKLIMALYLILLLLGLGSGVYYLASEFFPHQKPFQVICGLFVFYWLYDLTLRFMISSLPVVAIKPLLVLNLDRDKIVKYTLVKGYFTFFNFLHFFFLVPLVITLIINEQSVLQSVLWGISMWVLLSCNSYLNIFLNKADKFFYPFVLIVSVVLFGHFNNWFDILPYTAPVVNFFYENTFAVALPFVFLMLLIFVSYKFYYNQLYLDKGLEKTASEVKSLNIPVLNKLGSVGTFIKNDLYLIIRNKRPRTVILTSLLFMFYPFLIKIGYQGNDFMAIFGAIFACGGFMMSFGQFIPSWDSAYYPLLMTQNVKYHNYLLSKWYIIVFANIATMLLCSFYLFIEPKFYLYIIAATIFNIGINANVVLLMGVYIRQPIDLTSNKGAFGNTKAFNINTFILSLVMMILPLLIVLGIKTLANEYIALLVLSVVGIIGLFFRNSIFEKIVNLYKKYKYVTLKEFKQ
nr:DUF5687 family protein [uncultured Flavobacterium sp.]